ncbi:MAG: 30S ribosomal protein S4 [Candidatus Aenigmarchaeota archaeon]|nr:30S ribosomal protein S4 [Candidatus Aenigmarchaeota archaeon]
MGDPRRRRKKTYEKPRRPFDRLDEERKIMREFGLRRKRELWKAETILREFRRRARELASKIGAGEEYKKEEEKLLTRLNRLGLSVSNLDDVLRLTVEDILSRRMQTIIFKKGLVNTPKQARQFIVHGHILINGRRIQSPSFLVPKELEDKISLSAKIKEKMIKNEIEKQKEEAPNETKEGGE